MKKHYRIIDANLNRAREALRVIEDALRFVLEDENLSKEIKKLRHAADKILRNDYAVLITARDSASDTGRKTKEPAKKTLQGLITSNFKRAGEALRTLEEYSKVVFASQAAKFKKLRFKVYALEKKFFLKHKDKL
jgi:thiamine-phosphate pyrophosphorylase